MPNPGLSEDEMLEALRLVSEYGSITEAARQIGLKRETLQSRVNKAREKFVASKHAASPSAETTFDEAVIDAIQKSGRARGFSFE